MFGGVCVRACAERGVVRERGDGWHLFSGIGIGIATKSLSCLESAGVVWGVCGRVGMELRSRGLRERDLQLVLGERF